MTHLISLPLLSKRHTSRTTHASFNAAAAARSVGMLQPPLRKLALAICDVSLLWFSFIM